jgi:hypothetical protein
MQRIDGAEIIMTKYRVMLARTEYLAQYVEVEAESKEDAQDKAWDKAGKWKCVEAEEFTNGVEEITPQTENAVLNLWNT